MPHPKTAKVGGRPVRDRAILEWAAGLIEAVFLDDIAAAAGAAAAGAAAPAAPAGTGERR